MSIRTVLGRLTSSFACVACLTLLPQTSSAQGINLASCEGLWFSTSEDFVARRTDPDTGAASTVISDGDLLSYTLGGTTLCARNQELLRPFDTNEFDLGLDALDKIVLSSQRVYAAFSTEIDSVNGAGQFTAGDLLFTTGFSIPNAALLVRFNLPPSLNLGLDAVHIEGTPEALRLLMEILSGIDPKDLRESPGRLIEILEETDTDILFSTEATPPRTQSPQFLDGDLLSARTGTIVRSNADLLPALPAGIPARGVDYGLDAYTPALDPIEIVPLELFSTEVNARKNTISDGDALTVGPGLFLRNIGLLNTFNPRDDDMGLDALADREREVASCAAGITAVSHIDVAGRIDPLTGLYDTVRAFGRDIRVQGHLPGPGCPRYDTHEFQTRVSVNGDPAIAVLHPASLNWMINEAPCAGLATPYMDNMGWFALTQYQRVVDCPNDESIAIWRSTTNVTNAVANVDVQLVMRPIAGGPEVIADTVRIRVDNKRPEDVTMALYKDGDTEPFDDQCKIEGEGQDLLLDIRGTFTDDHFDHYDLTWSADGNIGGAVPDTGLGRAYNSGRPELTDTGTNPTPPETNILLEDFNLTQAFMDRTGGPLIECGYSILLRVFDRTRLGAGNFADNAFSINDAGNSASYLQSFCLIP